MTVAFRAVAEYRIDDLARLAGTTVRNVRAYQDRGLLSRPRIDGRVALYSDGHLARLRLVSQMLQRGFSLGHIEELLAAWADGRDLGDVLGLEAQVLSPWSDEAPGSITRDRLAALWGGAVTDEDLAHAVSAGLLEPDGEHWRVPSPQLLRASADLVDAGLTVSAVLDLDEEVARATDDIAKRILDVVVPQLFPEWKAGGRLPSADKVAERATAVQRLRPLAKTAVDAHLARAMEGQIREWLALGLPAVFGSDRAADAPVDG